MTDIIVVWSFRLWYSNHFTDIFRMFDPGVCSLLSTRPDLSSGPAPNSIYYDWPPRNYCVRCTAVSLLANLNTNLLLKRSTRYLGPRGLCNPKSDPLERDVLLSENSIRLINFNYFVKKNAYTGTHWMLRSVLLRLCHIKKKKENVHFPSKLLYRSNRFRFAIILILDFLFAVHVPLFLLFTRPIQSWSPLLYKCSHTPCLVQFLTILCFILTFNL